MDLTTATQPYLIIHGIITIGAVIAALIRTEHRITKLETTLHYLKESHDILTAHGTHPHQTQKNPIPNH